MSGLRLGRNIESPDRSTIRCFASSSVSVAQWDAPGRDMWTVPVVADSAEYSRSVARRWNMRIEGTYSPSCMREQRAELILVVREGLEPSTSAL
jgi:hypothetical protein